MSSRSTAKLVELLLTKNEQEYEGGDSPLLALHVWRPESSPLRSLPALEDEADGSDYSTTTSTRWTMLLPIPW